MQKVGIETKSTALANGLVSFIASTDSVDRMGDRVRQDGWDLSQFKKNPVILWSHDHSIPPIGRAKRIEVKNGRLEMDVEYTPEDINPFGAMIGRMAKAGFLPAVSVGFRPLESRPLKSGGYEFLKNELLEVSSVGVPANQDAVQFAKSFANDDHIRRLFASQSQSLRIRQAQARHKTNLAKYME